MNELSPHDLLWCVRRLPKSVYHLMKKNPGTLFIAGGYVRSCISNERVNDIDIFSANANAAKAAALVLAEGDEKRLHVTDNAISVKRTTPMVQFIHRWTFTTPQECIASFDFTIASASFWWDGVKWVSVVHPTFYADLAAKRLVYLSPVRNEDAGGSMLRVLKFYQRGYRIPLDSLGAVVSRLTMGVRDIGPMNEDRRALILTGLLREVDPQIDPDHIAHLPSMSDANDQESS